MDKYNYFGLTTIKGKEHNCIKQKKLQYAEKENGTCIPFLLFKATLFVISKLHIKFNKNLFPNVYIILKKPTRFR